MPPMMATNGCSTWIGSLSFRLTVNDLEDHIERYFDRSDPLALYSFSERTQAVSSSFAIKVPLGLAFSTSARASIVVSSVNRCTYSGLVGLELFLRSPFQS